MDELKSKILKVIESSSEPLTGTAVAKNCGYAKGTTRTSNLIQELIDEKAIRSEVGTKGYYVYSAIGSTGQTSSTVSSPKTTIKNETFVIPTATHNYKITEGEKGDGYCFKITFPDGGNVSLGERERLVVINDDKKYRFIVSEPEGILQAIGTFTQEVGYVHFLVTNMSSGKYVKSVGELGRDVILFLKIDRHNKAGI